MNNFKLLTLLLAITMLPALSEALEQTVEWKWSQDHRIFNVKAHGDSPISLEGVGGSVEIDGKVRFLENAQVVSGPEDVGESGKKGSKVKYMLSGTDCSWTWEFTDIDGGLEITGVLENSGVNPLIVGNWNLLHLAKDRGGRFAATEKPGDVRFFRWNSWNMHVERLSRSNGKRHSENFCLLYDPLSKQTFMSAFMTMDRMRCSHAVDYSVSHGIGEYKATCSFGKYQLQPGQKLVSERLRITFYDDPYQALEEWADRIYDLKKPTFAELPPVGLQGSTWIDAWNEQEGRYSEVALENARSVREKLAGFDIDIFRVSTFTSLKDGIPGNWMKASERHFSNGYVNFIKELNKLGFKPGIWVAPFWFFSEADGVLEKNRENLLRDCNGKPITEIMNWGGDLGDITPWTRLHKYYLDGTHPKTVEFVKEVFSYLREIGIRFYMLDFLDVPANSCLYDPTQTRLQAAVNIMKVIRETAGKDTHLQTAVSSTPAFTGLIDAARVGRDFGEGRPLQGAPLSDWRNATYVLHDYHYAYTPAFIQNAAASYFTHRKLYINDLNVLAIDKPVPLEHARIAATIFGLSGTPVMLGDDFRRISPDRLRMIKMCLPRTQGMPVPIDLFDHVAPDDYSRYLKLPVSTGWGDYTLIAVFNEDETAFDATLDFAKIGIDPDKPYRIYEFWTEEYCGTYKERFNYVIPPKSCRLFRISEARNYPWLLSTDMHIQQGAVEIKDLQWDEKRMRLSGAAIRPVGQVGNLYFLMPRKMRVTNPKGLWLMKELEDMNVIIRKQIRFENEREDFEIFFEPWQEKYVTAKPLMPFATEAEWLEYVKKHRKPGDTRVIE